MADTLKQLGNQIGRTARDVEFLNRRNGLLPQVEEVRGNVHKSGAYLAVFRINHAPRRVGMRLEFYKAQII